MTKTHPILLVESALAAAFAMVLSLIPDFASWFTPSFGAIVLILFSLRRGTSYGLLAGFLWGLLHFPLSKVYYLSIPQVFIEYILAFTAMGTAGLFAAPVRQSLHRNDWRKTNLFAILGATVACLLRYGCHYIAGVIFWGSYAPKGVSPYWYSFSINGPAFIITLVFTSLALLYVIKRHKQFLITLP